MINRDSNSPSVTIGCGGHEAIHRAVAGTHAFIGDRMLAPGDAARLAIVVEELVTNLVEHGSAGDDGGIELVLTESGGMIAIMLSDDGAPFDPRDVASDPAIPERGGGAGLDLVRAWTRIVDYRSEGGRNRLLLELPIGA